MGRNCGLGNVEAMRSADPFRITHFNLDRAFPVDPSIARSYSTQPHVSR